MMNGLSLWSTEKISMSKNSDRKNKKQKIRRRPLSKSWMTKLSQRETCLKRNKNEINSLLVIFKTDKRSWL